MAEVKRYYNATGLVNYTYKGVVYAGPFPEEWAKDHMVNTGPNECGNCACYGSTYHGGRLEGKMFLGYCGNCAKNYGGERGRGLVGFGEENPDPDIEDYPSIYDTYMKGVDVASLDTSEVSSDAKGSEFDTWYCQSDMVVAEGEPSSYKVIVRDGVILDTDAYEAHIADLRRKGLTQDEIDVVLYGNIKDAQSIMNTIYVYQG